MFAKDLFLRTKNLTAAASGCARLLSGVRPPAATGSRPPAALSGTRPPAALFGTQPPAANSPMPPAAPSVPPAATTQRPPAATLREHVDSAAQRAQNTNTEHIRTNVDRKRPLPGPAYAGSSNTQGHEADGEDDLSFYCQPAASGDEEAIELKQPPVDVTAPGGLADPRASEPTGERLATKAERRVYSQTDDVNAGPDVTRGRAGLGGEGVKLEEKKRADAREVQEQVQSTRERDLEKMRKTGVMGEDQPEKELENHKRKT